MGRRTISRVETPDNKKLILKGKQMTDESMPGIQITVAGEANTGKTLVSNIINRSLVKSGFVNVVIVGSHGEPIAPCEPKTIIDMVRINRPDLFEQPITINEVETSPDIDSIGDNLEDDEEENNLGISDPISLAETLNQIDAMETMED